MSLLPISGFPPPCILFEALVLMARLKRLCEAGGDQMLVQVVEYGSIGKFDSTMSVRYSLLTVYYMM